MGQSTADYTSSSEGMGNLRNTGDAKDSLVSNDSEDQDWLWSCSHLADLWRRCRPVHPPEK